MSTTCRGSRGTGRTSRRRPDPPWPLLRPADQLAVQQREPAVRVGGPALPPVGDPLQLVLRRLFASVGRPRHVGDEDALRPHAAPPVAVLLIGEAPGARG